MLGFTSLPHALPTVQPGLSTNPSSLSCLHLWAGIIAWVELSSSSGEDVIGSLPLKCLLQNFCYVCRRWGESSQVKILVPVNTLCFFPFFLSLCNRGKPRKEEVCFFVLFVRKRLLNLLLRMFELNPLAWGGYFYLIWLFFEQAVKKQNETEGSMLSSWKEASGL